MKTFVCAVWAVVFFAATAFGQIPSYAVSSGALDSSSRWTWTHDSGTPGTSTGSSAYPVSSPSLTGAAREFHVSYYDHGGERYHLSFGNNASATHFVYDTYVYIEDPSQVANLEMDLNQVLSTGRTVFLATQCSSYSRSWEYTYVSNGSSHWHTSNLPCNPKTWTAKTWHHVQIGLHRSGEVVTHDWIRLDGKISYFNNATGAAAKSLHWQVGDLVLNVQPDGASSNNGSIKLYMDRLQVLHW